MGHEALRIADSANVVLGLQDEIRRSEESRYDHRLHGVLLVAQGLTCPEVAGLLGDAPARSNTGWGVSGEGLAGLQEGDVRSATPFEPEQWESGYRSSQGAERGRDERHLWDGKTLAAWIERQHGARLGVASARDSFDNWGSVYASRVRWWRRLTRNDKKHIKKTPALMADPTVDCGRPTRCIFSNMGRAAGCGFRRRPKIRFCCIHPTRRSVGYFGAVRLRDGKFFFHRETDKFNGATSSHS